MNGANSENIKQELLRKTGVDFSRYRDPRLTDALSNVVTFPLYFARTLTRPIGLMVLLLVLGLIMSDSYYWRSFLVFPGLPLAIINGVLLGLVLFIRRIRNDMNQVFAISSDLSLQALRDISTARQNLARSGARFPSLRDVFHGVNAIVIFPTILQIMERKIPLLGGLTARITRWIFFGVDARIAAGLAAEDPGSGDSNSGEGPAEMAVWLQSAERVIHAARGNIQKIVNAASRLVTFPFAFLLLVVSTVSSAILYTAWAVLG